MAPVILYAPGWRRGGAVLVDYGIAFGIMAAVEEVSRSDVLEVISVVLGVSYFLVKDAVLRGKSIGKLLFGLLVVRKEDLGPISWWQSIKRNSPPVLLVAATVPLSLGMALVLSTKIVGKAVGGALLASLVSIYKGSDGEAHAILGDKWASTLVVTQWNWANQSLQHNAIAGRFSVCDRNSSRG